MLSSILSVLVLLAAPAITLARSVSGQPPCNAAGTTGGGNGKTVTPNTPAELRSYLESPDAFTIVLGETFDFIGTEGNATETGCAPWGTASGCQLAINANNWCSADAPPAEVTYDKAGILAIRVKSNKSIIGQGDKGIIKGKGLYFGGGVSNVILQNVKITELNAPYVWGGDAITLDGASNIWIDHVTISRIGRHMIVAGYKTNKKIAITNCELDGRTDWSAQCNGQHYWALLFTGKNDEITFKGNYIHHTSGRSPKVNSGTRLHAVNNYWGESEGHSFEGEGGHVLLEGSTMSNIKTVLYDWKGPIFAPASTDQACQAVMKRDCVANSFPNSGSIPESSPSVMSKFQGVACIDADPHANNVPQTAGFGRL